MLPLCVDECVLVDESLDGENLARVPEGVEQVCRDLQSEEGISSIRLGRQVEERRTVSQVCTAHSLETSQYQQQRTARDGTILQVCRPLVGLEAFIAVVESSAHVTKGGNISSRLHCGIERWPGVEQVCAQNVHVFRHVKATHFGS